MDDVAVEARPVLGLGIHDDVPNEVYHAADGISRSGLVAFAGNAARYRWGERPTTRSLAFGSLIHTAVLEPEQLATRYCTTPLLRFDERQKAYQEEVLRAAGRELVKQLEYDEACRIADAALSHPVLADLVGPELVIERSFVWIDPATSVLCRGRADGIHTGKRVMLDLKSTVDAGPETFSKSAYDFRYHWQDPMYRDGYELAGGFKPEAFIFVAVEKVKPYLTAAYELDHVAVAKGRNDVAFHLASYRDCLLRDRWPGHSEFIEPLDIPSYAYRT